MLVRMPSPTPPKPTASELELLRILWQPGPATARQVHDAIAAERPDLIHKAFSGSGKALILAARRGHVSAGERAEIKAILDADKAP